MKESSKERLLMAKSLKDVNGPWEMIAFLYMWRKRELFQSLFLASFLVNVFFIMKYTNFIQYLIKKFI